jgi:hypothetical protein
MASPMMVFESMPALSRTALPRTSYGTPRLAPKAPLPKTFAESKAPMTKSSAMRNGHVYGESKAGAMQKPSDGLWKDLNNDPEKDET